MTTNEEETDASTTIAAGLMDFGLGALVTAALMKRPSAQEAFAQRLRANLARNGVTLAAAELGRTAAAPVWMLTLRLPAGLLNVQAPIAPQTDPNSLAIADDIAQRVAQYLQPYGSRVA